MRDFCFGSGIVQLRRLIQDLDGGMDAARSAARSRLTLLLQLVGTAVVLGWLPGNGMKLAAAVLLWAVTFRQISGRELLIVIAVDVVFSAMDLGALHSGVFRFQHPDLIGLPLYEYVMWGYYVLHALRFVGCAPARPRFLAGLALAIMFAVPFATVTEPMMLFGVSSTILIASLAVFRDPVDFVYTGYLIAVGCVIEYVGVWTGQWVYPGPTLGGVAPWFVPMWGGVGLFTGRLLAPIVYPRQSGHNERREVALAG